MGGTQSCAIGLDVGGTKIAGGLVALPSGKLLVKRTIPTQPQRGGPAVLMDALRLAGQLLEEAGTAGRAVAGIGVSVCELVDLESNVTSHHTVAWAGLPVQAEFSRLAPAVVEADVRAHALAEATWGAGQGQRQFVFITIGTGISSCLVLDGRPYAGARGNALVLASSPLTAPCPVCGNTRWPTLEELASGPALVARYNALTKRQAVRAEEVIAAAETGETDACEIVCSGGRALGASLGWLVNILDPEVIIVGGGLGSARGLYWASLVESTREHIWADASRDLPVIQASLGPDAALAGAALAIARRANIPEVPERIATGG
jgi:glucokinase